MIHRYERLRHDLDLRVDGSSCFGTQSVFRGQPSSVELHPHGLQIGDFVLDLVPLLLVAVTRAQAARKQFLTRLLEVLQSLVYHTLEHDHLVVADAGVAVSTDQLAQLGRGVGESDLDAELYQIDVNGGRSRFPAHLLQLSNNAIGDLLARADEAPDGVHEDLSYFVDVRCEKSSLSLLFNNIYTIKSILSKTGL